MGMLIDEGGFRAPQGVGAKLPGSRRAEASTDSGLHLDSAGDYSKAFKDFSGSATAGCSASSSTGGMEHPSDDVMTQLVQAEFEDHTGRDPRA